MMTLLLGACPCLVYFIVAMLVLILDRVLVYVE